jgi:hypothetical protein
MAPKKAIVLNSILSINVWSEGYVRLRAAAGISVIVLILSNCFLIQPFALNASADYEVPTLTEGDYWEYSTTFVSGMTIFEGTLRYEMMGKEELTVGALTHTAFYIYLSGAGTYDGQMPGVPASGSWTIMGSAYYHNVSYRLLKTEERLTLDGSQSSGSSSGYMYESKTYEFLSGTWQMPFEVGESGQVRSRVVSNSSYKMGQYDWAEERTYIEVVDYSCLRMEEVATHAGTFNAYLVKMENQDGTYTKIWYSPEAGGSVKNWYYDGNGEYVGGDVLESYLYKSSQKDSTDPMQTIMILMAAVIALAVIVPLILAYKRKKPKAEALADIPDGSFRCRSGQNRARIRLSTSDSRTSPSSVIARRFQRTLWYDRIGTKGFDTEGPSEDDSGAECEEPEALGGRPESELRVDQFWHSLRCSRRHHCWPLRDRATAQWFHREHT